MSKISYFVRFSHFGATDGRGSAVHFFSPAQYTVKDQLSSVLSFMYWNGIVIEGFASSKDVDGIYIDRKGKWIVVPNDNYIKFILGPPSILSEGTE